MLRVDAAWVVLMSLRGMEQIKVISVDFFVDFVDLSIQGVFLVVGHGPIDPACTGKHQ